MTNPGDADKKGDLTPQGNAPSWVDEVMDASRAAPAPTPAPPPVMPAPSPVPQPRPAAPAARPAPPTAWPEDLRIPDPAPTPPRAAAHDDDDWVARATGAQAKNPSLPQGPAVVPPPTRSDLDTLGDTARQAMQQVQSALKSAGSGSASSGSAGVGGLGSGAVGQKKLIAGLLAIFLGSFGVHKFYLGLTTPGLILLGANVGVWVLALIVGLLLFIVGLALTLPLAGLVSAAIGLFGLVEGIIYLTKSDADFEREYLVNKKPWL